MDCDEIKQKHNSPVGMKASEVIVGLQEMIAKHGDLECFVYDDWNEFPLTDIHHSEEIYIPKDDIRCDIYREGIVLRYEPYRGEK